MDPKDVKIRWQQHYSLGTQVVQTVIQEQVDFVEIELVDSPMTEANDIIARIKAGL